MKTKLFMGTAALAFCAVACQNDEMALIQENAFRGTYTAVMEQPIDTRSAVTDEGVFSWTDGDKITVISSDGNATENIDMTVVEGKGTFTLSGIDNPKYGTYPQIAKEYAGGTLTEVTLPDTYDAYSGSTNAAMFTDMEGIADYNTDEVKFRHLAGVLCIKFKSMPAGYNQLVFTATDKKITGDFSVDMSDANPRIALGDAEGSGSAVTFNFTAKSAYEPMTFYVPLPVGTYGELIVQLKNTTNGDTFTQKTSTAVKTMNRRTLALLPEITEVTADERVLTAGLYYSIDGGAYQPYPETVGTTFAAAKTLKIISVADGATPTPGADAPSYALTPAILRAALQTKPAELLVLDLKEAFYWDADKNAGDVVAFPSTTDKTNLTYAPSPLLVNFPESKLSKIIVPDNVTKIFVAEGAETAPFTLKSSNVNHHPNLTAVEWNVEKVTELDCRNLTGGAERQLAIPSLENVVKIGEEVFFYSQIAGELDLSSCVNIGNKAFQQTPNLKSVTFAQAVTIGEYAFYGTTSLTSVNGSKFIKSLGNYCFSSSKLGGELDLSGCSTLGKFAFSNTAISKVIIGSDLLEIPNSAFVATSSLNSVDFTSANSELVIREHAFERSSVGPTLHVKAGLVHPEAFLRTYNLANLTLEVGTKLFEYIDVATDSKAEIEPLMGNGILFNSAKTALYRYPASEAETYEIPSSVTTIAYGAFAGNKNLKKITFADRAEKIVLGQYYDEGNASNQFSSLTFGVIEKLVEIDMSNVVIEDLWDRTFHACYELKKVCLPKDLKKIHRKAFNMCYKLETIVCATSTAPDLEEGFDNHFSGCGTQVESGVAKKVIVPARTLETGYKSSGFYTALVGLGYTFEEAAE